MLPAAIDWPTVIRAILFAMFAGLTAILNAITGPTYDQLLVPMLQSAAVYPAFSAGGGSGDFLAPAVRFSNYLLVSVVDPAVGLVALGVAVLPLARTLVARWADSLSGLLPRLVLAVIIANFSLPIAGGFLDLAAAVYPVFAGWDAGAWEHWENLSGYAQLSFSWDNGVFAFVLAVVEFLEVLGLVLAVGVRDALLSVLVVLLPVFTLLWPLRPVAAIARRAWLLFVELAFLPSVLVVPLELAVGTSSPALLVGYLGIALASPFLLSVAGTHLVAFGFPSSGANVAAGVSRGLASAGSGVGTLAEPAAGAAAGSRRAGGRALAGAIRAGGRASLPLSAPLAASAMVGHSAVHLLRHLPSAAAPGGRSWAPVRDGGTR